MNTVLIERDIHKLKKLALETMEKIESFEIQEKCANQNSTSKETKELFLKKAEERR